VITVHGGSYHRPVPYREVIMITEPAADQATAGPGDRPDPMRRVALAGGIAYLVTFAASIPQLALFAPLVADPAGFVSAPGGDLAVRWGSLLEIITAAACVATAVALYPVTRRVSATAAIGFVTSRVVEAVLILVGVLCVLTVVTLQAQPAAGTEATRVAAEALVAMRQWTFLLGPGLLPGVNALLLGYVMYRSRLVPRLIPAVGLAGAPIILASAIGTLFGAWDQVSAVGAAAALPVALWELSLGLYLTVKGFRPVPAAIGD
jgi:hypothetical protein